MQRVLETRITQISRRTLNAEGTENTHHSDITRLFSLDVFTGFAGGGCAVSVAQPSPTLCDPMDCSPSGFLCPWGSPMPSLNSIQTQLNMRQILKPGFLGLRGMDRASWAAPSAWHMPASLCSFPLSAGAPLDCPPPLLSSLFCSSHLPCTPSTKKCR